MKHLSRRRSSLANSGFMAALGLLGVAMTGCSTLPQAGPSTGEIVDRFSVKNEKNPAANPMGVRIIDLTPNVAEAVEHAPQESLRKIDALRVNVSTDRIGPGDILSVSIYEAGPGLFGQARSLGATESSAEAGNAAGLMSAANSGGTTSESLPHLMVDHNGRITIPYVGQVLVAGRTPSEVQNIIQERLRGKASEAQVLVSVVTSDTNIVYVAGDVKQSGRFPLTLSGENVLDVISMAGGPTHPSQDMLVKVTRHGQQAQTALTNVQTIPSENIPLESQDRVQVDYEPRTFLVFGATGKVAQVPFDSARVSLAEAVARSGGLDDQRADPESVFLFRFETPFVARALDQPADKPMVPIIYHVNMRDPQTFFLLQKFAMRDKDLVYVANAGTVQLYKFLQLVNAVFTPVAYSAAIKNY